MTLQRPLTGEPLSLDLVDSTWRDAGVLHDVLATRAGHAGWLEEHGLPGPADAAARRNLVATRDALRGLLEQPTSPAAIAGVDAVLDHGRIRLRAGAERETVEVAAAWRVPWLAARDLVDHLAAHPERLRGCANPECVLWFLDTTRSRSRRWCSMAACGNRIKVRRHYDRHR
jgi:predicted RNA-binding Zn ribbon-like protein